MADEVIIPFSAKALDVAKTKAKEILGLAKEAAKEIKDKLQKRQFLADARAQAKATIAQGKERERLGALAKRTTFDPSSKPQINRAFGRVNEVREKAGAIFGAVADFRLGSGITSIAGLGGFGPAGAALAAVAGIVTAQIEKRIETRQKAEARAILARVEQRLREADYASRLERDASFRAIQERKTREAFIRERENGRGWHPRSARFAEVQ